MEVATPHLSTPSSPKKHLGKHFLSAPTSPRRISEFYHNFADDVSATSRSVAAVPFNWEEKPGTPKSPKPTNACEDDDFAFDVSDETETSRILPAEELFDCGKIRPLKPLPYIKLRTEKDECQNRKRFPISDIRGTFSPRKKKEFDPVRKQVPNTENRSVNKRERERVSSLSSSNLRHRGARSVSPYRVSKYPWEEEQTAELTCETPSLSSSSSKNRRKWRLKDLFLFRSASEGRAAERDPLRKYTRFFMRRENVKFEGSDSGSSLRRRGRVSAHELHYTVNRAASEDLKKKTFLPYKQGILGRLAFNPAVHALANGFGFSRK